MPRLNAANNATSVLDGGISDTATSLVVVDGSDFPAAPFRITINNEIIEVGSVSTNTFSDLERGKEGTTTVSHSDGDTVENRWTAGTFEELVSEEGDYSNLRARATTKDDVGLGNVLDKEQLGVNEKAADSELWDGYEVQKNGTDGNGIINFKTG